MSTVVITEASRIIAELKNDRRILRQARAAAQEGDTEKAIKILLNSQTQS